MTNAPTLTVSAGSLPYLLQCNRCIQRRLHLKHALSPWMFQNNRHQQRRELVRDMRHRELGALGAEFPQGTLCENGKRVESSPIPVPGHERRVVLTGQIDLFAVVEDQISAVVYVDPPPPRNDQAIFRAPQLQAYSYALRNPAKQVVRLRPREDLALGMLSCQPGTRMLTDNAVPWLDPPPMWLPCSWTDADLLSALNWVLTVYAQGVATAFAPAPACSWCQQEKP